MNVAIVLEMAADGLGGRVAIGPRDGVHTYDALRLAARGIATRLEASGATTLALLAENSTVLPSAFFGAAWAGVTYAPLNYRLPDAARRELLDRLELVEVLEPEGSMQLTKDVDRPFPDDPERPAVVLFTSGTSAAPKAAVLTHDQLLAYLFNTVEFGSAGDDEAVLLAVPPFHVAGVAAVLSSTYAGRRIVPLPRFTPNGWLAAARTEAVTHAFVVPTMLARIVAAMDADPDARVPTLRHLAYGGARMPAPVLERALELFPDAGFVNAYGLTETSSTVAVLGPDDHRDAVASDDPAVRARLSSVGRPVPGIEVRIVDDTGANVPVGETGEVLVQGAQVSGEYLGDESRTDGGGWLHTGDRGRVDPDGYVFVEGRGDDTIIRGAENIAPAEVEDALLRHPAVASAAVVGLPDPEWGERVGAMITLRAGATPTSIDAVRDFARERLGSLKAPEVLVVRDELPHSATGKILRREVRAGLAAPDDGCSAR